MRMVQVFQETIVSTACVIYDSYHFFDAIIFNYRINTPFFRGSYCMYNFFSGTCVMMVKKQKQ
jgi:hypothetical protein